MIKDLYEAPHECNGCSKSMEIIYDNICAGTDIRANLIALKKEIQEENNKRALVCLLAGNFEVLIELLEHEDAKVRKNAVLILGEMEATRGYTGCPKSMDRNMGAPCGYTGCPKNMDRNMDSVEMLPVIFQAYEKEKQLFVKSDYLKAMSKCEYKSFLPALKMRLKQLYEMTPEEGNLKHIREEIRILQDMILHYEKPKKHVFTGYDKETEVIMLTNRNYRQVTKAQITSGKITMLAGGIRVLTRDLKSIIQIRTYTEMLFPIPGAGALSGTPEAMARQLGKSKMEVFLAKRHKGSLPFYYRVEMKSPMTLEKKSGFLKKFTAALDRETGQALINSKSDYEIELRLIENKEGKYIPLLKLYTLPDPRFQYRKQVVSSSIAPANAALFMQLAKPYLKENAQILDPFCGVGTMLIERCRLLPAKSVYGLDILGEAVEKARENTDHTDLMIHYINRDFFDFKHEYLFDELLSNMPDVSKGKDTGQIVKLYEKFFKRIPDLMKPDGIALLYSKSPEIFRRCLKQSAGYQIMEEWRIQDRDETYLFLIGDKEKVRRTENV